MVISNCFYSRNSQSQLLNILVGIGCPLHFAPCIQLRNRLTLDASYSARFLTGSVMGLWPGGLSCSVCCLLRGHSVAYPHYPQQQKHHRWLIGSGRSAFRPVPVDHRTVRRRRFLSWPQSSCQRSYGNIIRKGGCRVYLMVGLAFMQFGMQIKSNGG